MVICQAFLLSSRMMSINKASISIHFVPQAIMLALLLVCDALNMIEQSFLRSLRA